MNKQRKKDGGRGIEWCTRTWNPIAGCQHGCQWRMPDGSVAICYADTVATSRLVGDHYPKGFNHHYWHPSRLGSPRGIRTPEVIFINSMSDLGGHWVPREQVEAILKVVRECPHHTFIALTKAPAKLLDYAELLPENLWVLASSPPDFMNGRWLTQTQQQRMLATSLEMLHRISHHVQVVGMSFEPLSWDVTAVMDTAHPLAWAIVGAASTGPKYHQPDEAHVKRLFSLMDETATPVFMKGNLACDAYGNFEDKADERREDWPLAPAAVAKLCQEDYEAGHRSSPMMRRYWLTHL